MGLLSVGLWNNVNRLEPGYPSSAGLKDTRTAQLLLQPLYAAKEQYRRQEPGKYIELTHWQQWYGYQTEYRTSVP